MNHRRKASSTTQERQHTAKPRSAPSEFRTRLKLARMKADLTQSHIANHLGIQPQAVSLWESGDGMPRHDHLLALPGVLGCDPMWLFYGMEVPRRAKATRTQILHIDNGVASVPLIDSMRAARYPHHLSASHMPTIQVPVKVAPGSFAIQIWDASNSHIGLGMSFEVGDTVIVDPQRSPKSNDIVFVGLAGHKARTPFVGRLLNTGKGQVVIPMNPAVPGIDMSENDIIIGVVVTCIRSVSG